jgi:plastocyanin
MAEAASRAEVQPGAPLGTKPDAPQSAGERPQVPRREAATQQDRTVVIRNGTCMPDKVSIRPGEAVQWINYSTQTVHLATTSMQQATGVEGTGAFSSDVGPGRVYRQLFNRPGSYEYTCRVGNGQPTKARIEVQTE